MSEQLPTIIPPTAHTVSTDTYIVPSLIADAGDAAGWRFVEFFTANINNDHTRRAYARACCQFFGWCETRSLTLSSIRPAGAPVAVLRIGEGLILIPEQNRFRILCESIASVLDRRQLAPPDLLDTLPVARRRVFLRRYPELAKPKRGRAKRSKAR